MTITIITEKMEDNFTNQPMATISPDHLITWSPDHLVTWSPAQMKGLIQKEMKDENEKVVIFNRIALVGCRRV